MRHVHEFLYRGPTPNNNGQGAWHVIIAETVDVLGEVRLIVSDALTPAKAVELGFTLERITGEITAQAIAEKEAAEQARDAAITERDAARAELAAKTATLAQQAELIRTLTPEPETATKAVKKSAK